MKTKRLILGLFFLIPALFLAVSAEAARKRVKGQWGYTDQPYWQVGSLNKALSNACQRGEFGQRKQYLLTIGYVGQKGRGITGIANSNWNLYDPKGLAKPRMTFHFFNHGFLDLVIVSLHRNLISCVKQIYQEFRHLCLFY